MHDYARARPSHTPRLDERVALKDGRQLAYAEWGPADGTPVVFFHGTPGSRLFCPDEPATDDAGVRFVSFDRAGYGRSDVAAGLVGFPAFVPDVIELLDHLGIERAALVGWSGGGPHALAVAALEPLRVTSVGLSSSAVINASDETRDASDAGAPPEVLELIRRIADDPAGRRDLARSRCQWLSDDPTELVDLTERFVPEVLSAPGMREAMSALFVEAARSGIEGYLNDYVTTFASDVGYDLTAIHVPVTVWYGEKDRNAVPAASLATARLIPGCESIGCAECGHFTLVAHWPEMLDRIV
jgi:pimeloyl-ACP methyl ester carboxylesterase